MSVVHVLDISLVGTLIVVLRKCHSFIYSGCEGNGKKY